MKKRSAVEYMGYVYLLLALINYYGPRFGGVLGSWLIFIVAVAFLVYGVTKNRKAEKVEKKERKAATYTAATKRRMKKNR